MLRIRLALTCVAVLLALPASAQQLEPDARFALQAVPGGVLRLDRRTGEVAHCRQEASDWACRAVTDETRAAREEAARLERDNAELRRRIEGLERTRRPFVEGPSVRMPSDAELDEAFGLMERFLERGRRLIDRWRPGDRT